MPEPTDEEISALLKELQDKLIFDKEHVEDIHRTLLEDKALGCIRILAALDAKVEKNDLSRPTADSYIARLGFSEETIENRRKSLREKQFANKKLN